MAQGRWGVVAGRPGGKIPSSFSQALFWSQRVGLGEGAWGERLWESYLLIPVPLKQGRWPRSQQGQRLA